MPTEELTVAESSTATIVIREETEAVVFPIAAIADISIEFADTKILSEGDEVDSR